MFTHCCSVFSMTNRAASVEARMRLMWSTSFSPRVSMMAWAGGGLLAAVRRGFENRSNPVSTSLSVSSHSSTRDSFCPTQMEHIAVPKKMEKIQISIQPVNQGLGNGRRPCSSRLSHQIQKVTMPRLALGRSVVTFCGNTLKDVFNAVIKGMKHCAKRGKLVLIRRVRCALLE